jgi:hypothetical protein
MRCSGTPQTGRHRTGFAEAQVVADYAVGRGERGDHDHLLAGAGDQYVEQVRVGHEPRGRFTATALTTGPEP